MVELAIREQCPFVVISGDLFDGQWRDYRTGLYFASQMAQLRDSGIRVFLILGNHDAENRFASRLKLTDNVTLFSSKKPETARIEALKTAIHGRSFATRDVTENLAASYPPPVPGFLNIGLLHTALEGRENHASYAPCTIEQLKNHGYDYWALGHVHEFSCESGHEGSEPWVVYSGVPKGVVLVSVDDDAITSVEQVALDSLRWSLLRVDVGPAADSDDLITLVRRSIEGVWRENADRSLALRIVLEGRTSLNGALTADKAEVREQIETCAAGISSEIWLEKVEFRTEPPIILERSQTGVDASIADRVGSIIESRASDPEFRRYAAPMLEEIRSKMPSSVCDNDAAERMLTEALAGARKLALAVLDRGLE